MSKGTVEYCKRLKMTECISFIIMIYFPSNISISFLSSLLIIYRTNLFHSLSYTCKIICLLNSLQKYAQVGDSVEIDCGVPCVKLNGKERNDLVDIGSQFFDLEVGHNEIKIASDNDVNFTALFNKKYL